MLKRPQYIALMVVVLLALLLLNLPSQTTARIKTALGAVFLPLFGLASSTHQLASKTGDLVVPRSALLKENEALRREVQQLRLAAIQSDEILRENNRLHSLIGWSQKTPWKLRLASIVLREPANWWRTAQIDLGSRDGVRTNLPVLTTDGLVGRIGAVSLTRSQVILMGDPNCKVAAVVENAAHDTGIIEIAGPFDGSLLQLGYLSQDANLTPGARVFTSGLGGVFPKGIPIGQIVDSHKVEYGLSSEARVKPFANISALEEVWVLFP